MAEKKKKKVTVVSSRPVNPKENLAVTTKTKGNDGVTVTAKKLTDEQKKTRQQNRKNKSASVKPGGIKSLGSTIKTKTPGFAKKSDTPTVDLVSQGKKDRDAKKKVSGAQKRADRRKKRRFGRADKLREKASKYKSGDKKAQRLEKRAKRQVQIGRGDRKTGVGAALKAVGKGAQAVGHAYAYGTTKRLKGNKVTSKKGGTGKSAGTGFEKFTKPNPASKKPLGGKFKVLSLSDSEKKNK